MEGAPASVLQQDTCFSADETCSLTLCNHVGPAGMDREGCARAAAEVPRPRQASAAGRV